MIPFFSWILTFGLCFFVFKHSDTPVLILGIYYLIALLLRWWLVRRINKVNERKRKAIRDFEYAQSTKRRKSVLFEKYKSEKIVARIMNREIWKGATTSMLVDAMGVPHHKQKDGDVETWCYGQVGKNRYKNRVKLKDGVVLNWTNKN